MRTVTIASGTSLSPAIGLERMHLTGIAMPAAWTAASITIQGDPGDGVFRDLYDCCGDEFVVSAAAGRMILVEPSLTAGLFAIKIRSGLSAAPTNQGAARTIALALRPYA